MRSLPRHRSCPVLVLLFVLPLVLLAPARATALTVLTESYPPFNDATEDGLVGSSVAVVEALLHKLGEQAEIRLMPWTRAYNIALKEPETCLFSMTRTPEREPLFKWVGPIGITRLVLVTRTGGPAIASVAAAKQLHLAAGKNTPGHYLLKNHRFEQFELHFPYQTETVFHKLLAGRIDAYAGHLRPIFYRAAKLGMPEGALTPALSLQTQELYIAFSRHVADATIARWQTALDELKATGEFERLQAAAYAEMDLPPLPDIPDEPDRPDQPDRPVTP